MKKISLLSLFVVLVICLNGCKYDDGPLVSIHSKSKRVANSWIPESATINGLEGLISDSVGTYVGSLAIPSTSPYLKEITFLEEGECLAVFQTFSSMGNWDLSKKDAILNVRTTQVYLDWTILQLNENHLKVTYITNGNLYEVKFKTKK